MAPRLGIDVGGTFTDLMYCDPDSGEVVVAKGPSTPGSPNQGVIALVRSALTTDQLSGVSHFLHGSTVGLNALLERNGAAVGLLTTAGFRDALEIRRGDRGAATYDILWKPPSPLVSRPLRRVVTERISEDGSVLTPIELDDVLAAAAYFTAEGIDSVAVAFLHSYINPAHELAAAQALRDGGFTGDISLSHQMSGELGFYERTSTTVIDAYVRPLMSDYLGDLESEMARLGMQGECLITRAGGGALPFSEARQRPFEAIISGPVAGAVGAGKLCATRGIKRAITADVGGTSFDTCLIIDGQPQVKYQGEVLEMPVQSSWIDVRSVGAGGGSLASVAAGLLHVGPESAGATPGPACYGRGGSAPTVTDAAAALGMLGTGQLAGGLALDIAAAQEAIGGIAEQLGLTADATAAGIVRIANAAMAVAVRTITVEQGVDPRDAVLLAFGGAGPLFGALLADELGIEETLVPVHAGNFSAVGLLGQDIMRSAARTLIAPFDADSLQRAEAVAAAVFETLPAGTKRELAFDMRYAGQLHTLTVEVPNDEGRPALGVDGIAALFDASYERSFGYTMPGPLEIVAVRGTSRTPLVELPVNGSTTEGARPGTVDAYSFRRAARTKFEVIDRATLEVNTRLPGPLIVVEPTTTTYVDAGFTIEAQPDGTLLICNLEVSR